MVEKEGVKIFFLDFDFGVVFVLDLDLDLLVFLFLGLVMFRSSPQTFLAMKSEGLSLYLWMYLSI